MLLQICRTSIVYASNDKMYNFAGGWSDESTLALINSFGERKEIFDRANNKAQLWSEVAAHVSEHGPEYSGEQCASKWTILKQTYQDFKQQLNVSGNNSSVIAWPYFEPINLILSDSVGVEPEYTFAAGVESQSHHRQPEDQPSSSKGKTPRKSSASVKKTPKMYKKSPASAKKPEKVKRKRRLSMSARKLKLKEKQLQIQQFNSQVMVKLLMHTMGSDAKDLTAIMPMDSSDVESVDDSEEEDDPMELSD